MNSSDGAEKDEFERIVEQVIADLPEELREVLDTCSIIITDWAEREQLEELGADTIDETPYGLYQGTPVGERTPGNDTFLLPDIIFLFRGPLIEDFPDVEERAEQIRITLVHELGHMIGFDEDDLTERGLE